MTFYIAVDSNVMGWDLRDKKRHRWYILKHISIRSYYSVMTKCFLFQCFRLCQFEIQFRIVIFFTITKNCISMLSSLCVITINPCTSLRVFRKNYIINMKLQHKNTISNLKIDKFVHKVLNIYAKWLTPY